MKLPELNGGGGGRGPIPGNGGGGGGIGPFESPEFGGGGGGLGTEVIPKENFLNYYSMKYGEMKKGEITRH